MEADKKRKSAFSAISINRITAKRFRLFSKKVAGSHSDTLDDMMDFFEEAKISPKNKLMMYRFKFYQYLNSRFDYIEELLREQERNYHKPVLNMLTTLFSGVMVQEQQEPLLLEKKIIKLTREEWNREEKTVSLEKYETLKESRKLEQRKFLGVLKKFERVEPSFGKAYYRIDLDETGLAMLKRKLEP